MTTIQQGQAYDAIPRIAHALNRIANCLEAAEARAREKEKEMYLEGECSFDDCEDPVVMMLNGEKFCRRHVDDGFARLKPAMDAVRRGFEDIEGQS